MVTVDLLTLGEAMAALRSGGPLKLGGDLRLSVAGAESNVAIGLARLGHRARWIGRVGDDELGALVLRTLRAEGVDVADAVVAPGELTGMLLFDRAPGGTIRVHYRRAGCAGARLTPADVAPAVARGARVLHVTGITPALGDDAAAAVRYAVEGVRATGATICFDVNHRPKLWGRAQASATLRPLAAEAHIVVASEDELPLVCDGPDETTRVRALLDLGAREVVIKRGARGASAYTGTGRYDEPALTVRVVDSVGAGDAFTAGYLSALLDGLPVQERLRRGVTLGAAAVAAHGDWEGLPTRAELDQVGHAPDETLR
ncbi:sugar kinase [Micromonospora sp. CPCC 206061]|uniref:sugar kinase n=1 Tax=Micromonospora sp. CPCC 206061 TaxID=3122410 RepID=UPI002FF3A748